MLEPWRVRIAQEDGFAERLAADLDMPTEIVGATSAERADARLLALCAILGITSWTGLARLLRGETPGVAR